MVKKILMGLGVIVVAFVIFVATRPSEFKIERSTVIAAPAAVVFAQVNDLHKWEAWSPWAKKDRQAKNTFEGSASGRGSIFRWAGNKDVGEGSMEILESVPSELIRIRLNFLKPMESQSLTEFTFKQEGNQTAVNWAMSGHNNFVGRAFCVFMDMDKMVGGDFEAGLAEIKSISEAQAAATKGKKRA